MAIITEKQRKEVALRTILNNMKYTMANLIRVQERYGFNLNQARNDLGAAMSQVALEKYKDSPNFGTVKSEP